MNDYLDNIFEEETYIDEGNIFCSVCGKPLENSDKKYFLGNEAVCDDPECMDEFYENNADEMLVEFAKETGMTHEAICWFYENL